MKQRVDIVPEMNIDDGDLIQACDSKEHEFSSFCRNKNGVPPRQLLIPRLDPKT